MPHTSLVPVVETERLILRGHELSDVEDCAAMWADPTVVAYISGVPSTRDQPWARKLGFGDDVVETFGATEALFLHRPRQVAP